MLRDIINKHPKPRILAFHIDATTGTPLTDVGQRDATSITDNGGGDNTVNLAEGFTRGPAVFVSTYDTAPLAGASYPVIISRSNIAVEYRTQNNAGSTTDGNSSVIMMGFDNDQLAPGLNQIVKATWRKPVIYAGIVRSDGSVDSVQKDFTVTKGGTGIYNITYDRALGQRPVMYCVCGEAGIANGSGDPGVATAQVKTYTLAGVAADKQFHLWIFGSFSRDTNIGRLRQPIQSPQRKPELLIFETSTLGTVLSVGSLDGTIVKNGTGDYTITYARPFATNTFTVPMIGYIGGGGVLVPYAIAASATQVRINFATTGGTLTDPTICFIGILGFKDATGY